MRHEHLPADFFANNRRKLAREMKPNSIAVLCSNDLTPSTSDRFHPWRQDTDTLYLTGIDQEETYLILYPDAPNPEWREVLFLRETNEEIATWEGHKYTKEEGRSVSGIANVQWNDSFEKTLYLAMGQAEHVYLNLNEHPRYASGADYAAKRLARQTKRQYPLHKYERLAPIMHRLRAIKEKEEVDMMRKAADISHQTFLRLLKFIKPGVTEYGIEAEIIHEFIRRGAKGHSFEPIVASGPNACVLHYVTNDQPVRDGDLVLIDSGCEYGHYASDMTRCVPANGRFSSRQKEVYNAVLRVMRQAMQMLVPGNTIPEYHKAVGQAMEKELVDLGLLTLDDIRNQNPVWPAYKKYFPHGTSHFLGMDVHDLGNPWHPMAAGMAFSCEPGIYIREEGIGVRIENMVLVTENAPVDLMADIPIEVEQIEDLMNSRG